MRTSVKLPILSVLLRRSRSHRRCRRHVSEPCLHLVKCAAITNRILDAEGLRLARDVLDSVSRIRMVAEPLGTTRTAALLDRPEHVRHLVRIVAGPRHELG